MRSECAQNSNGKEENSEAPSGKVHWINHATFYLSVVLAVLTLGTLRVYYLQLQQMISATHAAESTARTGNAQYVASERPWIKALDLTPNGLFFSHSRSGQINGVQMNVIPSFQNVGHSVATHVRARFQLTVDPTSSGNILNVVSSSRDFGCNELLTQVDGPPDATIFPGDKSELRDYLATAPIESRNHGSASGSHGIEAVITGCVDYRFGDLPKHYQTRFAYGIYRARDRSFVLNLGESLQKAETVLTRYPELDSAN